MTSAKAQNLVVRAVNLGLFLCSIASPAVTATLHPTPTAAHTGAWGLEVTIDSSCPAPADVVLGPGPVAGSFTGCRSITAADADFIPPGAELTAGEWIALHDEITTTPLTDFSAVVESSLYPFAFVRDLSPSGEALYVAEFALRLDGLTLAPGDRVVHFAGNDAGGMARFTVILEHSGGQNRLLLGAREDDGTELETPATLALPSGWNEIEVIYEGRGRRRQRGGGLERRAAGGADRARQRRRADRDGGVGGSRRAVHRDLGDARAGRVSLDAVGDLTGSRLRQFG